MLQELQFRLRRAGWGRFCWGMSSFASVRRADKCDPSTSWMISNFSDGALWADLDQPNRLPGNRYLIRGRPHRPACFFKQAEFEGLLGHDFLQIAGLEPPACGCDISNAGFPNLKNATSASDGVRPHSAK